MATSIINVADMGELGEGNDTAIFQAALDSVPSQGGTVIYPAPIYVPTGSLTISKHRSHVLGAGLYATEIVPTDSFSGKVFDFTKSAAVLYWGRYKSENSDLYHRYQRLQT
jgi:hypothetical protein